VHFRDSLVDMVAVVGCTYATQEIVSGIATDEEAATTDVP